jgi:hypothetical protein
MDLAEESLLAELIMSRRLDFGKNFRNRQARYGLSVKDEAEWMENDAAARWLQKNENRALRKGIPRITNPPGMKLPRRTRNIDLQILIRAIRMTNCQASI